MCLCMFVCVFVCVSLFLCVCFCVCLSVFACVCVCECACLCLRVSFLLVRFKKMPKRPLSSLCCLSLFSVHHESRWMDFHEIVYL